jgi:hypothetical protein
MRRILVSVVDLAGTIGGLVVSDFDIHIIRCRVSGVFEIRMSLLVDGCVFTRI